MNTLNLIQLNLRSPYEVWNESVSHRGQDTLCRIGQRGGEHRTVGDGSFLFDCFR